MKILKIFLAFLLVMVLMGACTFWLRAKWDRDYEQTELGKRNHEISEKTKEINEKNESIRQALDEIDERIKELEGLE